MNKKNKKAISEIVSYTLLVVIALVIGSLIYAFLKLYVPKEKPECKEGINIIIENTNCISSEKISFTLQNTGLFSIDRAFIKIGKAESRIRESLSPSYSPYNFPPDGKLKPSQSHTINIQIDSIPITLTAGEYILEVQPAHFTKEGSTDPNTLALCKPATQKITCT